jgi:hypothetical protein
MRIVGEWRETATTVPRPYIRAHVETHDGNWVQCVFLVDTGTDRTVLTADVGHQLGRPTVPSPRQLGGIGGVVETHEVWTTLRLTGEVGERFNLAGNYGVFVDPLIGECILGYDVLLRFALVVDKPSDSVCLIHPPHRYIIQNS